MGSSSYDVEMMRLCLCGDFAVGCSKAVLSRNFCFDSFNGLGPRRQDVGERLCGPGYAGCVESAMACIPLDPIFHSKEEGREFQGSSKLRLSWAPAQLTLLTLLGVQQICNFTLRVKT
jgi:hypothetical protein